LINLIRSLTTIFTESDTSFYCEKENNGNSNIAIPAIHNKFFIGFSPFFNLLNNLSIKLPSLIEMFTRL